MSQVDKQLDTLKSEIEQEIPNDITVTDVKYEGPELVVYTRDPKEFAGDGDLIRRLALQAPEADHDPPGPERPRSRRRVPRRRSGR